MVQKFQKGALGDLSWLFSTGFSMCANHYIYLLAVELICSAINSRRFFGTSSLSILAGFCLCVDILQVVGHTDKTYLSQNLNRHQTTLHMHQLPSVYGKCASTLVYRPFINSHPPFKFWKPPENVAISLFFRSLNGGRIPSSSSCLFIIQSCPSDAFAVCSIFRRMR